MNTLYGAGGVGAGILGGIIGSAIIPGPGTAAGALLLGGGYMGLTDVWSPGGVSMKDQTKTNIYESLIKPVNSEGIDNGLIFFGP